MERVQVPANPGRLINAIANIGYDPEVALCDLIDNSVDAGASKIGVELVRHFSGEGYADTIAEYRIADDGCGMDRAALISAFTLGSNRDYPAHSLGKFGLGLKSAGLSVGNEIALVTKTQSMSEPIGAILRVADITDEYTILLGAPSEADLRLWSEFGATSGTLLLLRDLNDNQPAFSRFEPYLRRYCGTVYHVFLADEKRGLELRIGSDRVQPLDPLFMSEAQANGPLVQPNDWDGKSVKLLLDDQALPISEKSPVR